MERGRRLPAKIGVREQLLGGLLASVDRFPIPHGIPQMPIETPKTEGRLRPVEHVSKVGAAFEQVDVLVDESPELEAPLAAVPFPDAGVQRLLGLGPAHVRVHGTMPHRADPVDFLRKEIDLDGQRAREYREILRGAASVRHRATVHLFRGNRSLSTHGRTLVPGDEFAASASGGSQVTWVFDPVSVMIFDDYPDDFPIVETSLDIDEMMATEMTPYEAGIMTTGSFQELQTFQLELRFRSVDLHARVLNLACLVEVRAPGSDVVLATHPMRMRAKQQDGVPNRRINAVLQMVQAEGLDADSAAWLKDAVLGKQAKVRLVFKPSREEAMRSPVMSRYWGGEIDCVVPLRKK